MSALRGKGESLRREDRLRRRAEFLSTQQTGKKWVTADLLVFHLATPSPVRLGVTVSKRVGTAVVRNRVKRRLREIFRRNRDLFPSTGNVVLVARPTAAKVPFAKLRLQLERLKLASPGHEMSTPK